MFWRGCLLITMPVTRSRCHAAIFIDQYLNSRSVVVNNRCAVPPLSPVGHVTPLGQPQCVYWLLWRWPSCVWGVIVLGSSDSRPFIGSGQRTGRGLIATNDCEGIDWALHRRAGRWRDLRARLAWRSGVCTDLSKSRGGGSWIISDSRVCGSC